MRDFQRLVREHVRPLGLPPQHELKIVEELAAQIEDAYHGLIAGGLSDEDAWIELQQQMPDWEAVGQELLDEEPIIVRFAPPEPRRPWARLSLGLARDLQAAARLVVKDRGFTLSILLTLAICLGVNAAIFTVVHSVLLRPLPVPDSHRLVAMGDVYPTISPTDILSNTVPAYLDRLKAVTTLQDQALFGFWFDTLTIDGIPQEIRGMRATPSLFRVLQVQPALGRAFTEAEGEPGADQKIILSHGLWQRLYGGDTTVIGRTLRLGFTGQAYTIVGVMPRGFSFFDLGSAGHARTANDDVQFWIPLAFTPAHRSEASRTRYSFYHVGRLRPDASVDQVRAQIDALNAETIRRFPDLQFAELGMYTAVTPLQDALTLSVRRILYLLWGGAAFVLLIGALNIGNLALARASGRTRELATRVALGASRFRVVRQLIVEGVLLASVGGVAGLAVGHAMLRALASSGLADIPNGSAVQIDATVVFAILATAILVGALIGLVSATFVDGSNLNQTLAEGNRLGTSGRSSRFFRRGLVVAQVALSIVLLTGAGLLLASFRNLLAVDAGFDPQRVTTATIFPPPSRYSDQQSIAELLNRILESIRRIPGVQAAGITSNIALSGRTSPASVSAADVPPQQNAAPVLPSVVSVTPGYFEAIGTPLVRGRYFSDSDRENTQLVAIVDERLAKRFWPDDDPIGKSLSRGGSEPSTVVGVVRHVRFESLTGQSDSTGAAYFPYRQMAVPSRLRWLAVKTAGELPGVIRALRASVAAIDPDLPLSDTQTMTQRTAQSVVAQRLAMGLAGVFGIVALLLSVLGIYGVLAYVVAQKSREIGIRVALGSTPRGIFRLFFNEGLILTACGLVLGLLGAVTIGRALEGQVFGVEPTDPLILTAVTGATAIVALLACVSPAYRATLVDPLTVLNDQ